jgi:ubiquinone biosynthesis protein UbiJ
MPACIFSRGRGGKRLSEGAAYNPAAMLDTLSNLLAPPVLERLTLVLNHVLRAEPAALQRLLPHAGRTLTMSLAGWPALLPTPPALAWRVTPAGLLEWCGLPAIPGASGASGAPAAAGAPADLRISVDAGNPAALFARALAGERPTVQVEGDATFAADIGWLLQNLRWDVAADLERLFGPVLAHQLHQVGRALARGLRAALNTMGAVAGASSSPLTDKLAQLASRLGPGRR